MVSAEQLRSEDVAYITSVLAATNATRDGVGNGLEMHATTLDGDGMPTTSQPSFSRTVHSSLYDAELNNDLVIERMGCSPLLAAGASNAGEVRRCLKPLTTGPTDFAALPGECPGVVGSEKTDFTVSAGPTCTLSTTKFSTAAATGRHHPGNQGTPAGGYSVEKYRTSNSTPSIDPKTDEQTFFGENSIIPLDDSLEAPDETALAADTAPNGSSVLTQVLSNSLEAVDSLENKQESPLVAKRMGLCTEQSFKATSMPLHETESFLRNKPNSQTTATLESQEKYLPCTNNTEDLSYLLSEFSPEHQDILHTHNITKRKEDFLSGIWDSSTDSSCEDVV